MRYELQRQVEKSFDFEKGVSHFELNMEGVGSVTMGHDKEVSGF